VIGCNGLNLPYQEMPSCELMDLPASLEPKDDQNLGGGPRHGCLFFNTFGDSPEVTEYEVHMTWVIYILPTTEEWREGSYSIEPKRCIFVY